MTGLHLTSCTTAEIAEAHAHRVVAAAELVAELVAALKLAIPMMEEAQEALCERDDVCIIDGQDGLRIALFAADAAIARAEGAAS